MPTYEYVCENGHRVEAYQRFEDPPLTTCSECGAPLRKVFHPAGVVFKGSGFYATDNRKGRRPSEESKPASSSSASGDGKASGGTGSHDSGESGAPPAKEKSA